MEIQSKELRSFLYRYPLLTFLSLIICYSTDKFHFFYCFTGLAYIDVQKLRKEHIRESFDGKQWIMTKRQKTNISTNVPLLEVPQRILKKYESKQMNNGMILPVPSNQKLNSYLKEIADVCNINKNLTFHMARHAKKPYPPIKQRVNRETSFSR